jgi:hypothetical protein
MYRHTGDCRQCDGSSSGAFVTIDADLDTAQFDVDSNVCPVKDKLIAVIYAVPD